MFRKVEEIRILKKKPRLSVVLKHFRNDAIKRGVEIYFKKCVRNIPASSDGLSWD